jgi:hypothetical protein
MIDYSYLNSISNAEDLRLYILEHTLDIEETTSKTLGYILKIDWEQSKSFGYSSVSLSFNQKIHIIQDLKGLDSNDKQKLADLMTIRNKFVHVKSIKTFQDLFNIGAAGQDVKKHLVKWYGSKDNIIDEELRYKIYFFWLYLDVKSILIRKIGEDAMEKGKKAGELDFLKAVKEKILELPVGNEIISKTLEDMKEMLKS